MFPDNTQVRDLPYYLYSIGMHECQPRFHRPFGFDKDQFFYSIHGSGVLILDGKKYDVPPGDGFFIPKCVPHEYYPLGDVWDIRYMVPEGAALESLYGILGLHGGVWHLWNRDGLEIQMNKMRSELMDSSVKGIFLASSHVQEFIMEFAKQAELLNTDEKPAFNVINTYSEHMLVIEDYVKNHFTEQLRAMQLCRILNITPQHLCRIVRASTGMRTMEYVNSVRINKAKDLLGRTEMSASEICILCGFENENYFHRVFKKMTGITPGEYRKRYVAEGIN